MATMDPPTRVTPVFDKATNIVLGNIYNYLKSQAGKEFDDSEITERLDELNDIVASDTKARGSNDRAVQAALKGLSDNQKADKNARVSNDRATQAALKGLSDNQKKEVATRGSNDRATQKALKGIIGNQSKESRAAGRDRATQKALFGKLDKDTINSRKSLDSFKDKMSNALKGLTDFLKTTLKASLKHQADLAKMMRMQYLTGAQKDAIQKMANSAQSITEQHYGIKVSRDDLNIYYKELIAGGKDLEAMGDKHSAAYAALRQSGIDDDRAYQMAMSASDAVIKQYVNQASDAVTRATMSNVMRGLDDLDFAIGGVDKTLKDTMAASKSIAGSLGQAGINIGADYIQNQIRYSNGMYERVNGTMIALTDTIDDFSQSGKSLKGALQNTGKTTMRAFASSGDATMATFAMDAAKVRNIEAAGNSTAARVRSQKENEEALSINTSNGTLFYEIEKAFGAVDNSMGGILGKLSNRMDEIFGDSLGVEKLLSVGFSIVTKLLTTLVFNTQGGVLGIVFRLGSTALAVTMIKKLIENKDKFKSFLDPIIKAAESILPPSMIETFKNIFNILSKAFAIFEPLVSTITSFASSIFDKLSAFFEPLTARLTETSAAFSSIIGGISNSNESVVDRIFNYLNKKLPEIGEFFKNTVTPFASELLNFLGGLTKQLWENTIKPLIPNLVSALAENWPIVLGAFAVACLPNILGTLLTSVLPKLLMSVMPKLVALLAAHPIALAIAAVVGGIAAGGMWLWDRHLEEEDAKKAAKETAIAERNAFFANQDYLEAVKNLGPNDPVTKHLREIADSTELAVLEKRQEQRKKEAIAKLDDEEAKHAIEGLPVILADIQRNQSDLERFRKDLDSAKKSGNVDQQKQIEGFIKTEERRLQENQLTAMALIENSQNSTNTFGKTIDEIKKTLSDESDEDLIKLKDKHSIGNYYAETLGIIANTLPQDLKQSITESGILSNNFGKGSETVTETYDTGDMVMAKTRRNFELDHAKAFLSEVNSGVDTNLQALKSAGADSWNTTQLDQLITRLGLKDKVKATDSNVLDSISKFAHAEDIVKVTSILKDNFAIESKKTDDDMNKLLEGIRELENSNTKIDRESIKELANELSIKNNAAVNNVLLSRGLMTSEEYNRTLTPYARGGYVSKPTPALVGEDGEEVILPLSKPDAMTKALASLTDEQKDKIKRILDEGRFAYTANSLSKYATMEYGQSLADDIFSEMSSEQLKLLRQAIPVIYKSSDVGDLILFINSVIANNNAAFEEACQSVIGPYKKGDKHLIRNIDMSKYPTGVYDNPAIARQILDMCDSDLQKSHAFYDIMVPGVKLRAEAYNESMSNQGNTEGRDRIAGTPAEKALEAGASQIGKPYILQSLGNIGYVCNELTNYALKHSGADLGGFYVNQVASTFSRIMRGKDGYGHLKIRDDLTPDTAPPGMLFFQDSKSKDGTFSPGHVGLVYYGHKRLHSSGGASNFAKDKFLATWQSNKGVVIDDFPSNEKSKFKFGELPSLFVKPDGTVADVSASGGSDSSGLTAEQWDVLDDTFGYRADSVAAYTSRWLKKQLNPETTARQKKDDRSTKDLVDYVTDKTEENLKYSLEDAKAIEDKDVSADAMHKFYQKQSDLLKEGMGAVSPTVEVSKRHMAHVEIERFIDDNVKNRGDILAALSQITGYLRDVARSTKKPVAPATKTVNKPF